MSNKLIYVKIYLSIIMSLMFTLQMFHVNLIALVGKYHEYRL